MPDYETMSAQDALLHAKDVSGLTADEISRRAGVSPHILRRYFKATEPEYLPGLERIPALCRAMGNLVLLHWLEARCAALRPALPSAGNRADVLTAVARAGASLGDVQRALADSENGGITPACARELRGLLRDVITDCERAQGMLHTQARARDMTEAAPLFSLEQDGTAAAAQTRRPWWRFWERR